MGGREQTYTFLCDQVGRSRKGRKRKGSDERLEDRTTKSNIATVTGDKGVTEEGTKACNTLEG